VPPLFIFATSSTAALPPPGCKPVPVSACVVHLHLNGPLGCSLLAFCRLLMLTPSPAYSPNQFVPALACNPSAAQAPPPAPGATRNDTSAPGGAVGSTSVGGVPGWLYWLEELGMGLPLLASSAPSQAAERYAWISGPKGGDAIRSYRSLRLFSRLQCCFGHHTECKYKRRLWAVSICADRGTTLTAADPGLKLHCQLSALQQFGLQFNVCAAVLLPIPRPEFTVCSWTLNWGRILLEDVTVVAAASGLSTTASITMQETGMQLLPARLSAATCYTLL
jgi:hypothetical protein